MWTAADTMALAAGHLLHLGTWSVARKCRGATLRTVQGSLCRLLALVCCHGRCCLSWWFSSAVLQLHGSRNLPKHTDAREGHRSSSSRRPCCVFFWVWRHHFCFPCHLLDNDMYAVVVVITIVIVTVKIVVIKIAVEVVVVVVGSNPRPISCR